MAAPGRRGPGQRKHPGHALPGPDQAAELSGFPRDDPVKKKNKKPASGSTPEAFAL